MRPQNPDARHARYARLLAFVTLCALAACAPAARHVAASAPVRLGSAEVDQIATLLRLEDQQRFDVDTLRALAAAQSAPVRRYAAAAIGRIGGNGAADLLLPLLSDGDTSVAATAAFALGQLADTSATPALAAWLAPERAATAPTVAAEAATALGKARSEPGRAALVALLEDAPVGDVRLQTAAEGALLALWKYPRASQPAAPLVRWTRSPEPEVRWRAAYALVRRPDPAATAALAALASDRDARVRALAVRGLTAPLVDSAAIAAQTVLPLLIAATADGDYAVRINAARSLGTFRDARAISTLVGLLDSSDRHLAWAAAEVLGRAGEAGHAAAAPLRRLAEDRAQPVALRGAALLSLTELAPRDAAPVAAQLAAEPDFRARSAAARAYAALGPVPRAELAALARDGDPRVAGAALDAAVSAADSVAPLRPLLLESLGNADAMVRASALAGLAKLADPATLPVLLDAYATAQRDTMDDAALAAIDALAALRSPSAERAFFARFPRSSDAIARARAAAAFGDAATAAWGEVRPVATARAPAEYQRIARDYVAAPLAGAPLPRARIETAGGVIDVELLAPAAPLTVLNFLDLAERGYFDGQAWPRVVPNFVIQGGDPRGDTSGGPGYAIRDELNRVRYGRGTVGMALSGPDTGGSQFFITHSAQPHLDGTYTVFGQVIAGMDVVDRVLPGDRIDRITRTR